MTTTRAPAGTSGGLARALRSRGAHVILIALMLLWVVPSVGLLVTSFRSQEASTQTGWWTAPYEGGWTLDNYDEVLNSPDLPPPGFEDNFINTVIITIPATILPILIAAFAAYAFAWMHFKGRDWIFLGVVALLVVPLQVTWVPVLQTFNWVGDQAWLPFKLTGTWWGIWLAHTAYGLPFAIFLLRNFFADLPRDLFESARIDGASESTVFLSHPRVTNPMRGPSSGPTGSISSRTASTSRATSDRTGSGDSGKTGNCLVFIGS